VAGNTTPLPNGIAAGPDGNLWFADRGTIKAIGRITPGGTITEFPITVAGSSPRGIVAGPDGNVWFTDDATVPAIGLVCLTTGPLCSPSDVTTEAIHEYGVTANGGNGGTPAPRGITAGPDGNLWFADVGTTKAIGMINPATHVITEYTSDNPGNIAPGPDGNVWFTDRANTAIALICLTTGPLCSSADVSTHAIHNFLTPSGSTPEGVAAGPDGNLWFSDDGSKAIGTINPSTAAIAEYSIATNGGNPGSRPTGITAGPDGNLWFSDKGTGATPIPAIGRFGVGAPAALVTAPSVTGSGGVGTLQTCGGDVWSSWAGQQPSHSANGFDGYRWLLGGSPIAGATGPSYTPPVTAAELGQQLSCTATVTYTLLHVTVSATSAAVTLVDLTPPVLTLPAPILVAATGPDGAAVVYTATATDNVGTSPVVSCSPASGSTFAIGTTTVDCTAMAPFETTGTGSFTVHVEGAAEQLADLAAAVAGVGPGSSLADKIGNAQTMLGNDDVAGACGVLGAFIHEVNAQTGKKISPESAASLVGDATRIETVLGC
jgi:streptogramin lyase